MPDTPLSLVREEYEHTPSNFGVEQALGWRGTGLGHPGHDCWAFPRDWVPKLVLGFTLVGVSMVATDLMQALHVRGALKLVAQARVAQARAARALLSLSLSDAHAGSQRARTHTRSTHTQTRPPSPNTSALSSWPSRLLIRVHGPFFTLKPHGPVAPI